jgi:hypothetical protein
MLQAADFLLSDKFRNREKIGGDGET